MTTFSHRSTQKKQYLVQPNSSEEIFPDTRTKSKKTMNPLYNDIRYNSKIRYNGKSICANISGSCIFSLTVPCYSLGKHTSWIFVRIASPRRFQKYTKRMNYKKMFKSIRYSSVVITRVLCTYCQKQSSFAGHQLSYCNLPQHMKGVVGWCDGAGWASSAGASYNFDNCRARAYCACSRCGWGWFGHFYSHLSFLFFLPLFGRRLDID